MMKIGTKLHVASLALLLAAGSAQAVLVASESFDYGDQVNDATKMLRGSNDFNGGTGWSTNEWKATLGNPETGVGLRLDLSGSASLPYPAGSDLSSVGGRIADANGAGSKRDFAAKLGETNADTNYFSVLINWGGAGETMAMQLGDGTNVRWTPLIVNDSGQLQIGAAATAAGNTSAGFVQLTAGTDYMVVGRRTTSNNTARTVVGSVFDVSNAGEFLAEPVTWDMDLSFGSGTDLTQLLVSIGSTNSSNTSMIDEIRFGTTYADVVGVYENPALAYDNFDYEAGVAITNGNGGIGWDGAWVTDLASSPLLMNTTTNSLWFGNSDPFSYDGTGHIMGTALRTAKRNLTTAYDLASGDLYLAVLIRPFANNSNSLAKARFTMYDGVDGAGNCRLSVGFADSDDEDLLPNLYVRTSNAAYPGPTSSLYASNSIPETTHLLICKRKGSDGYIAASVYEGGTTNSLTEPGDEEWQVKVAGGTGVDLKSLFMEVASGTVRMDELALSDSFAGAIANIPEVVVLPPVDGDLPIEWVLDNFGSVFAYEQSGGSAGDPDDDGRTTEDEYFADTLPTNSASLLAGIVSEVTSSNVTYTYTNGGTNADVYVDFRADLVTGSWTPVITNMAPVSTSNSFVHGVSGDTGFYRIYAERND